MTYAHVTTYRLGTSDEVESDPGYYRIGDAADEVVSDQTARTIASWWHSLRQTSIVALSHGRPFDTDELRDEIGREIDSPTDAAALLAWVDALEILLADGE